MEKLTTKILIVGAGPVGMVLALLLHHAGVETIIIDKRDMPTLIPRAIVVNQATLELFSILGLNKIFQEGIKIPSIQIYWNNKKIRRLDFSNTNTNFSYFFHIQQSRIEAILEEEIVNKKIQYYRSTELVSFQQEKDSVQAEVKKYDEILKIKCNYLVGCDGGSSLVRDLIQSSCLTESYGAHFKLADVDFENGLCLEETHYHFTSQGYAMLVPIANKQTRIIFSCKGLLELKNKQTVDKSEFQTLLKQRINNYPVIKNVHWSTQANFGHRLSEKVFEGRVILAGDALHQFSPVGGTNMNVGLQDALSLAWRLSHILKQPLVSTSVVEDYEIERDFVIQEQQKMTQWFTGLMTRSKFYPKNKHYSLDNISQQLLGFVAPSHSSKHISDIYSQLISANYKDLSLC